MTVDKTGAVLEIRCPYSDCADFDVLRGLDDIKARICQSCKRPFTSRVSLHHSEMAKKGERIVSSSGGPLAELVVVVEDLRSLHNVGATFRTADGAGFGHLYLCGITGVPPRNQISKVALGSEEVVKWSFYPRVTDCLEHLKKSGYHIVALEKTEASKPLLQCLSKNLLRRPLALVIGNEVDGVSSEALYLSDLISHLSMRGVKNSLNVSVAFGAAAYMISEYFDLLEDGELQDQ